MCDIVHFELIGQVHHRINPSKEQFVLNVDGVDIVLQQEKRDSSGQLQPLVQIAQVVWIPH